MLIFLLTMGVGIHCQSGKCHSHAPCGSRNSLIITTGATLHLSGLSPMNSESSQKCGGDPSLDNFPAGDADKVHYAHMRFIIILKRHSDVGSTKRQTCAPDTHYYGLYGTNRLMYTWMSPGCDLNEKNEREIVYYLSWLTI